MLKNELTSLPCQFAEKLAFLFIWHNYRKRQGYKFYFLRSIHFLKIQ